MVGGFYPTVDKFIGGFFIVFARQIPPTRKVLDFPKVVSLRKQTDFPRVAWRRRKIGVLSQARKCHYWRKTKGNVAYRFSPAPSF